MNCSLCPHAKPLAFAVYCKLDSELRDLPASMGHVLTPPIIQKVAPSWCPLVAQKGGSACVS
jgi:hypothetical protein